MRRRSASGAHVRAAVSAAALLAVVACSGPAREAPAPPPITASAPPETPVATPPPAPSATELAAAAERVEPPTSTAPSTPAISQSLADPNVPPPSRLPDPNALPPATPPDPLKAMHDSQARRIDYDRRLAKLSAELGAARDLLAQRERDLLAFKNPFLPRPQLTADESQAIAGLGGEARAKWAEGRVTEARTKLEAAQKAYDDAKASPPLN